MSVDWFDGFDASDSTGILRRYDPGSTAFVTVGGRYGGGSIRGPNLYKTTSSVATRTVGFAYNITGGHNGAICRFQDSGTPQVELNAVTSGAQYVLTVSRNGTLLATSTNKINDSVWCYIEFATTIHATAGMYEVRVDGVQWLYSNTANTKNSANATTNQFALTFVGTGGNAALFDDFYSRNDGTFMGDCRVLTNMPTGDSATNKAFQRSTGSSNFALVDENPQNDDTDYVFSNNVGDIDTYTFGAISPSGTIVGARIVVTARKDDAGNRQIGIESRVGGTNRDGANVLALASTYTSLVEMYLNDPSTSAPWTIAGLNAAEFGQKVTL
jgi:hypothetical protein